MFPFPLEDKLQNRLAPPPRLVMPQRPLHYVDFNSTSYFMTIKEHYNLMAYRLSKLYLNSDLIFRLIESDAITSLPFLIR